MIHNFNSDGLESLDPKYASGRPAKFTLPERRQIKKIALSRPQDHRLPFSTWSLSKLAEFVVAEGAVDDISHAGLRTLLRDHPTVIICMDEFGPFNLQPHPGRHCAPVASERGDPTAPRRRRRRATYTRPNGVRHLTAGYDVPRRHRPRTT